MLSGTSIRRTSEKWKKNLLLRYLQKQGVLLGLNTAYDPLIEVILLMQGNLYYTNLSVSQLDNKESFVTVSYSKVPFNRNDLSKNLVYMQDK